MIVPLPRVIGGSGRGLTVALPSLPGARDEPTGLMVSGRRVIGGSIGFGVGRLTGRSTGRSIGFDGVRTVGAIGASSSMIGRRGGSGFVGEGFDGADGFEVEPGRSTGALGSFGFWTTGRGLTGFASTGLLPTGFLAIGSLSTGLRVGAGSTSSGFPRGLR